jgi:transketolase
MRKEFGKWITEMVEKDNSIYLLVGDIGYGIFDDFKKKYPNRYINMGICEQTMVGVAAGLALLGLKPYVYTITPFLVERAFEQVKIDINLNNVNVKLIGYDDYPTQGPTHAVTDNARFMEMFKNIESYWPDNSKETRKYLDESYESKKPTFIRLQGEKNG